MVAGNCRLRELLKQKGMLQRQLAELSGKSETQISDYVHNRRKMSLETALLFAKILGCHPGDLYE